MLQKAIVEEIIDQYSVRVRIPVYNKLKEDPTCTPTKDLYIASICTFPGVIPNYSVGDIVFVGFENGITSNPVVLGLLYSSKKYNSTTSAELSSLKVNIDTHLSSESYVDNFSLDNIKSIPYGGNTSGIKYNIYETTESWMETTIFDELTEMNNSQVMFLMKGNYKLIVNDFPYGETIWYPLVKVFKWDKEFDISNSMVEVYCSGNFYSSSDRFLCYGGLDKKYYWLDISMKDSGYISVTNGKPSENIYRYPIMNAVII